MRAASNLAKDPAAAHADLQRAMTIAPEDSRAYTGMAGLLVTQKKYADANGVPLRPISTDARRVLTSNRWPGNVRELENTIHRSVLMAQGDEIGVEAILSPDGDRLDTPKTMPAVAHATFAAEQVTRALVGRTVADVERDLILETLKHCLGNRTHAANILGISIRTLRNKLNEYADGGLPITPAGAGDYSRAAATANG